MMENTLIGDVMVRDVAYAILPGSRDEVLEILKDRKVSGVPVLKDDKVVGIISRTNLLRHPEEEQLTFLMTRDPVTVTPDMKVTDAARLMRKNMVRRLPVVEDGKLAGMVTVADIVWCMSKFAIEDPVLNYLDNGVGPLWYETPLPVVARHMELAHVRVVPILDSSLDIVGMISDRDIICSGVVEDSLQSSDMSAGNDDDEWTWESLRDTMSIYYNVSKLRVPNVPVKNVMVKDLVTVMDTSTVSDCARKMKRYQIDQIPVLNSENKYIGLLRDRDLLKALLDGEI